MRFELLRQRVERAEQRVAGRIDQAQTQRLALGQAWRRAWSPGRILIAGLLSGFLVGRAEPLSKVGGIRWLQMLGTVSSLLASLQAADAAQQADAAAADTASPQAGPAPAPASDDAGAATADTRAPASDPSGHLRPPAPAEAATEISER
ncbi:protein sip-5 [Pseudoxanthomonas broegbernensis]|uniref:Protein sip-5 n=1 Tax=Pseudoxanthomonas broegbernensis TaxID=83619 RepID=A0A7V8K773_9GAMM|nr:protein sip-5 [Pseudoxanthomonas broegbernensis]KAF1686704.1 protein sip-5 [Pseudoxanthomonas broegbernensis]MBB6063532.1 hypothetical protein [Pseudoxanthomonas broegbernensis]